MSLAYLLLGERGLDGALRVEDGIELFEGATLGLDTDEVPNDGLDCTGRDVLGQYRTLLRSDPWAARLTDIPSDEDPARR